MNALASTTAPANAFSDARIRRRLWFVLIAYEALVISIVAGAGLNIALMGGGSIAMAAPLALIACAEALRIPMSAMAVRLRWPGRLLAAVALLAIAIGSAEGLAVAFEAFLQNRIVEVSRAAGELARLTRDRAAHDADAASLAGEVKDIDAQSAALAKSMPQPPTASNRTCTWKGQRVSCSADAAATNAYREALQAYDSAQEPHRPARRASGQGGRSAGRTAANGPPGGASRRSRRRPPNRRSGADRCGVRRVRFRGDAGAVLSGQGVRDGDAGDRIRNAQHGGEHRRARETAQRGAQQARARRSEPWSPPDGKH